MARPKSQYLAWIEHRTYDLLRSTPKPYAAPVSGPQAGQYLVKLGDSHKETMKIPTALFSIKNKVLSSMFSTCPEDKEPVLDNAPVCIYREPGSNNEHVKKNTREAFFHTKLDNGK